MEVRLPQVDSAADDAGATQHAAHLLGAADLAGADRVGDQQQQPAPAADLEADGVLGAGG